MRFLLAAIAATVASVIELSLLPYLRIADVHPHPVLVLVVVWTIVGGLDSGLAVAFVGGLALDLLAPRPLGMSAFALLVAAGLAAVFARLLVRVRPLTPVIAVPGLSFAYSLILLASMGILGPPIPVADPAGALIPGVVYDGVLGLVVGPLAVSIRDRRAADDRVDW